MPIDGDATVPGPTEALEHLGRLTLREHTMQSLLQSVADLARQVMPGQSEASVSLLVDDRPSTAVYTGQLALDCDESQYGRGYGPCLHAAATGELTEITDARTETRWRDYVLSAVEHGSLASLSVPLPISEGIRGALNVYAREAHAYEDARETAENLQRALESRAVIDQAKGMLMERYGLTADLAFQALARVSMRSNTKLRDVAERLVRTGVFPLE